MSICHSVYDLNFLEGNTNTPPQPKLTLQLALYIFFFVVAVVVTWLSGYFVYYCFMPLICFLAVKNTLIGKRKGIPIRPSKVEGVDDDYWSVAFGAAAARSHSAECYVNKL